jgi:hypothetical protein
MFNRGAEGCPKGSFEAPAVSPGGFIALFSVGSGFLALARYWTDRR